MSTTVPREAWAVAVASARLQPHVALPVEVLGLPILLYRDAHGAVRGWLNICAHRSAPVVLHEQRCDRFRCPYHGWTYGTDGRLQRTPGFGGDAGEHALTAVAVHEADGLVWVRPAGTGPGAPPFLHALRAAGAPSAAGWQVHSTSRHPLAADWSVYVENYLEAYHIPFVHPSLSRDVVLDTYRVHVHEGFVTHEVERAPNAPAAGFWAWIWPATMLNVYEGGMNLERVLPEGPGRCTIEYTYLFDPAVKPDQRERALAQSEIVTAEDVAICEAVQRNLDTGLAVQGPLSPRHEGAITAFREWLQTGA
ncbi:MAG: aromatic ring-hydroxylating dioxygenase subunit alpha [Alphaproteobacteria bacterium]|nr:aromatic ring-hydroxylating dioxygenase subunit alpha [Alphaproteobacteria bacterium]MCB9692923.1 aromatic ring-hydroxylating dioxygenase subunit alpha [Alphaproteobacteria bacterium]